MKLEGEPIAIGAESTITKIEMWGKSFALKYRPSKAYLIPDIDQMLRGSRTSRECKGLTMARSLGIPTPAIHTVDLNDFSILMDYIPGKQLKQIAGDLDKAHLGKLCHRFGGIIACLHRGGIVHGDPTTSNLLVTPDDKVWMIDFGLSEMNATVEMKGVDLHLIKRALETTHWDIQDEMLSRTLEGYSETLGEDAEPILSRMEEIRERGRYH
ncbi:MAG: KEOPS complex kinase/ATPase Bud32 [Candidatus Thorarchaeota archaeon]